MTLQRFVAGVTIFIISLLVLPQLHAQQRTDQIAAAKAALGNKDPMLRHASISTIASYGHEAVPSLREALGDTNALVRENAAAALGEIGPDARSAIDELLRCLSDANPYVSGKAADALSRIGGEVVPSLMGVFTKANPAARHCVAIALAKLGPEASPAVQLLAAALKDSDEYVRWASTVALRNIGEPARAAVPALLDALADRDQDVRTGASFALEMIDPAASEVKHNWRMVATISDNLIPGLMEETHVPGVSVALINSDAVVWTKCYGVADVRSKTPVTHETLFEACSMSKPIFAYLAVKLVEQGRLDLDQPLAHYLDASALRGEPAARRITARMALSHTTGLPNWRKGGEEMDGPLPITFIPGSKFGYSGEGIFYLQQVVEQLTGLPLDVYARTMLFTPLHLEHVGYCWTDEFVSHLAAGHDSKGAFLSKTQYIHPNAAYSLYTSAEDYASLIIEMMNPDRSGRHSLSRRFLDTMLAHHVRVESREPVERPGKARGTAVSWGLGWCINSTAEGDLYHHSGANGSGFRCFSQFNPRRGSGIVIMCNGLGGSDLWTRLISRIGNF